jgi:hypothetical protein
MDLYYVVSSYRMGMAARAVLGVRGSSTVWTGGRQTPFGDQTRPSINERKEQIYNKRFLNVGTQSVTLAEAP